MALLSRVCGLRTVQQVCGGSHKVKFPLRHMFSGIRANSSVMFTQKLGSSALDSGAPSEEEDPEIIAFQQFQATANLIRPSLAEDTRTILESVGFGVLSTIGRADTAKDFPIGSVVEYAIDEEGKLIFAFSSLSPHSGDIKNNSKCSLTVMANGFSGLSDARFNIAGNIEPIEDSEIPAFKQIYLQKHPGSFWVDFGDFSWYKMEDIVNCRVVGGFGRIGNVTKDQYFSSSPDPVYKFSGPVCGHMNKDHSDSIISMVKHYVGITVDSAKMIDIDKHGINIVCVRGEDTFRCRLLYPSGVVTSRSEVKDAIVEMSKAAANTISQ